MIPSLYSVCRGGACLGLMVLACLPALASANSASDDRVITFSAGYRTGNGNGQNIVELGIAEQCGPSWCLQLARYHGARNLPRTHLPFRHRMQAPYSSAPCDGAAITTVIPGERSAGAAHAAWDHQKLLIKTGNMSYHWRRDPEVSNAYVLINVSADDDATTLDQIVGFAFTSSATVTGPIDRASIASYFHGQIYHKNAAMSVADPWHFKQSSVDFRQYKSDEDGKTLFMSTPGHPDVVKRIGKPAWVQFGIILDRDSSASTPLVQEYGHDFNMNGCFDEAGHNKFLLPVDTGTGIISAFVYVEYSPDKRDGIPMISVGRYYR